MWTSKGREVKIFKAIKILSLISQAKNFQVYYFICTRFAEGSKQIDFYLLTKIDQSGSVWPDAAVPEKQNINFVCLIMNNFALKSLVN